MKLSELIRVSQEMLEQLGDADVLCNEYSVNGLRLEKTSAQQAVEWECEIGEAYYDIRLGS